MNIIQSGLCHVCCNKGAQKHFGAICCAPCKMFFRRNVHYNLDTSICHFGGLCNITINTRHSCRICRFKKCLSVGMQKELLRASRLPSNQNTVKVQHTQYESTIYPLDLLQNDRSLLTTDQWNVLSNIIHAYDNTSPVSNIIDILTAQSTFPLKIRMKIVADRFLNVISSVFHSFGEFIRKLPQFSALQTNTKIELIQRHFRTVGEFGSIFVLREAKIYSSPIYKNFFNIHYGSEIHEQFLRIADQQELDGTIIKLFIAAIIFSTCTDVVQPTNSYHNNNEIYLSSNIKHLMNIQDIYVEIIFKYMLYRYGTRDAILRFAAIIKNFLDQSLFVINAGEQYQVKNEIIDKIRSDIIANSILQTEPM
ncbi:unnamed protein product [Adineta steineri]|uniref:Nuclear receptor domain-containing protein n=1 Tax=Adineta steineri TaxID=433720 RepID=A0A813N8G4_9BILA|nr:unnamed protein product [Adineta steineri]